MTQLKDSMTNIEKIRQELERLKNIAENDNASEYLRGQARVCRVILSFIDSLPGEKPSEDLEEAAKKRKLGITPIGIIRMKVQELKWADVDKAGDLDIHPLEKDKYDYSIKQCDKIIAFIDNLPLTIAKESPVLNEAADDYQTTFNKIIGPFYHDDQKRAFIDGALWQARQLIKSTPNRKP